MNRHSDGGAAMAVQLNDGSMPSEEHAQNNAYNKREYRNQNLARRRET